MHLQFEYVLLLSLLYIIHQKDWKTALCDVITFYFKIFLTYVNTIEYIYIYFAFSFYIYIFIHANMIHQ